MTTFVALLRGINVGGRNRLPMADLHAIVASLGFGDVQTHLQSGNVVFTGSGSSVKAGVDLGAGIHDQLGLEVPVIVRSKAQWARTVERHPLAGPGNDPRTLHVTFLARPPDVAHRTELAGLEAESGPGGRFGDDRFTLAGADVFLSCPGGYGETVLNNAFFERRSGQVATTRNWRTVTALAALAGITVPDPEPVPVTGMTRCPEPRRWRSRRRR